jgi:hypothetical protein
LAIPIEIVEDGISAYFRCQSDVVPAAGFNGNKVIDLACRHFALAVIVPAPSCEGTIVFKGETMGISGRDRDKVVTIRYFALTIGIVAPCYERSIGPEGKAVSFAGRDGDKIVSLRGVAALAEVVPAPGD